MPALITLLTDFGTSDGYVGEVKGVLLSGAPGAMVVDISHDVGAQDVEGARLAVARYWRRFPRGTVHLVVVDPGVGSPRAAIAVASDGRFLVGPDNGVLSPALLARDARAVALPLPAHASSTFHGRDVFAPAAALLAAGTPIEELGAPFDSPTIRRTPEARRLGDGRVLGEVISVDRFGNLITNIVAMNGGSVDIAARSLEVRRAYADVRAGELTALVGSLGFVEIAVRDGSAAATLEVGRGAPVLLHPPLVTPSQATGS
ncbi:MAG TPA: SAM-dependent chlorinase/fluorinase [Gemmatimonadaceae bacterium]|nr:SAM-dependent chlorinase/fluorinase [Gemmatimonadaceae bacterium]